MDDLALIEALLKLCVAAGERGEHETVDSWCHRDTTRHVSRTAKLLMRDPVIRANSAPQQMLWLVTGGGQGFGPQYWLPGYVREAEQGDAPEEAEEFLRLLRVADGSVAVEVQTTLIGLNLPLDTELELPFGRLRRAHPVEIAGIHHELPQAAVFSYRTRVPAAVAKANPFDEWPGDELAKVHRAHDERLTRLLVSLVLVHDAPVQEHLIRYEVRFTGSGVGINVPPLAPMVAGWPYASESGPRVERLQEYASQVARIRVDRLTVATRRYLRARAERIRPEDQIVDYAIAIEGLTRGAVGAERGQVLSSLVASTEAEAAGIERGAREIAEARNLILHEDTAPPNVLQAAVESRHLVRRSIEAVVRREIAGVQPPPAWQNVFPDALDHVRGWSRQRWHRGAAQPHSSQALCVSVFGTLARRRARTAILEDITKRSGLSLTLAAPRIVCEETEHARILNELGSRTTPTSPDVLATWRRGVLAIESKFVEAGFGPCSQPGKGFCSGDFAPGSDLKTRTAAPCRLMVWDRDRTPRLYWNIAAALFRPEVITPPQSPCPFAGPSYQLMRNLCFAAALAQSRSNGSEFGFLVAYVAASPSAPALRREVDHFLRLLLPEVRSRVGLISYETIADVLRAHGETELAEFIELRISEGLSTARC